MRLGVTTTPAAAIRQCMCIGIHEDAAGNFVEVRCVRRATPYNGRYGDHSDVCDDCNQWTGCVCDCGACSTHDYSTDGSHAARQGRGRTSPGGAGWHSSYTQPPGGHYSSGGGSFSGDPWGGGTGGGTGGGRVASTSGGTGDDDEPPIPPSATSMLPVDRLLQGVTWEDFIEAL